MRKNLAEIRAARPDFRSYVIPGKVHTSLLSAGFYATYVDGTSLRDWVTALVEGNSVADVGSRFLDAVPEPVIAAVDSLGMAADSLHAGAALHTGAPIDSLHLGHAAGHAAPTDSLHAGPGAPAAHIGMTHSAADSTHAPADSTQTTQPQHTPQDSTHR
jgi:hypothetical protein